MASQAHLVFGSCGPEEAAGILTVGGQFNRENGWSWYTRATRWMMNMREGGSTMSAKVVSIGLL